MDKVESFTHEGKTVTLYHDELCQDPRDADGHFLWLGFKHRHYNIGDETLPDSFKCHGCDGTGLADPDAEPVTGEGDDCPDCDGAGYCEAGDKGFDLVAWLTVEHKALLVVPVGMIDHSGVSFYLGGGSHWSDGAGWDSGTCGFMVCTEQMGKDFGNGEPFGAGWATLGEAGPDAIRKQMTAELDEYNSWNSGDCFGYVVTEPNVCPTCLHNEPIEGDSCWGFIGYDYAVSEAKAAIGMPND